METESYAKSRKMSQMYERRDDALLKEYGQRLKDIQSRQRKIGSMIKDLVEERDRIA